MTPILGGIAGWIAKRLGRKGAEAIGRILTGDTSDNTVAAAKIQLAALDAQGSLLQRNARPITMLLMAGIVVLYASLIPIGMLWDVLLDGRWGLGPLDWKGALDAAIPLLTVAGTFLTGIGGLRSWEKRHGRDENAPVGGGFLDAVTRARQLDADIDIPDRVERMPGIGKYRRPVDRPEEQPLDEPLDERALRNRLLAEEGVRYRTYRDTLGYLTAGVGHLITEDDPLYDQPDGTAVSEDQVVRWFAADMRSAINDARAVVPSFDEHPQDVRQVIVSMAFQLGRAGLSRFRRMIAALDDHDYALAALEAKDSLAYRQTPTRWRRHAATFDSYATAPA